MIDVEKKCIFIACTVNKPIIADKWCKKHYSWNRSGIIDDNGNMLRQPVIRKPPKCNAEYCNNTPIKHCKGLCLECFNRSENGNYIQRKKCKIKDCLYRGKLSKGFCEKHYMHMRRGYLDENGVELKELRRTYTENSQCKARGCKERAITKNFCVRHYGQLRRKLIDERGVPLRQFNMYNRKSVCSVSNCDKKAICRGYCENHYRMMRSGTLEQNINKQPKICRVDGCIKQQSAKEMCSAHYSKMKYILKRNKMISKRKKYYEKNKDIINQKLREKRSLEKIQALNAKTNHEISLTNCSASSS